MKPKAIKKERIILFPLRKKLTINPAKKMPTRISSVLSFCKAVNATAKISAGVGARISIN